MSGRFQRMLHRGTIVMDGAMGTELLSRGLEIGMPPEAWCITRPRDVSEVHRSYVEAGAEALVTNTFGAHAPLLAARGSSLAPEEIAAAAVQLAREAVGEGLVIGDVGPALAPGQASLDERIGSVRPLVAALVREDIDLLMFESIRDPRDVEVALEVRQLEAPGMDLIISATYLAPVQPDRLDPEAFAKLVEGRRPVLAGVNCTEVARFPHLMPLVDALVPLCLRPSGGLPGGILEPGTWAETLMGFPGAVFLGGCCGTTPGHIGALRMLVDRKRV